MLKNITLGQYYPADTPIHRMDPRMKILIAILLLVTIFVIDTFVGFLGLFLLLCVIIALSKVGVRTVLRGVRPLLFIIILMFVLNILFFQPDANMANEYIFGVPMNTVLVEWGYLKISVGGIIKAIFIAIRLVLLVMSASLLTLTTSPMELTDGMESLLSPMKKVRFPVHELSMMMSIAMRFIPTLIDETDRIMKAQTARGAEFDSGNILKKAKGMIPLLVPLFVSAFKRADELALAMESRCYRGGEGRTKMKVLRLHRTDWIALAVSVGICLFLMIYLRKYMGFL